MKLNGWKKGINKFRKKIGLVFTPKKLAILAIVVAVLLLVFNFRSLFLVAIVNWQPVTRYSLDRTLEKQAGKATLDNLITEVLINQEAGRLKVKVTPEDIQKKIEEIEKQVEQSGRKLDEILAAQRQTRKSLEEQLRTQVLVEKILGKDIVITDDEMKKFFEDNKNLFAKDTKFEDVKEEVRQELFNQRMGEKFQSWITDLKQKAKIYYLLNL